MRLRSLDEIRSEFLDRRAQENSKLSVKIEDAREARDALCSAQAST
jgi:hypothetical protein